jgi:outer membrane phospholipase A
VQHESNGRDGPSSRSLNLIYLRPTLTLGRPGGFQATLSPRACYYLAGLDDNPDLPRYRGYVDLRATLGWENCLRLAATGRVGERGNRGSLQLDLTYPLSRVSKGAIGVYLHLQFFTGYGESFLLYNERSSAFRAGFALFR